MIVYFNEKMADLTPQKICEPFIDNNFYFHYLDEKIVESFMFKNLRITNEEDKKTIKDIFHKRFVEEISFIQDNQSFNQEYKDRLYNFLIQTRFTSLSHENKIKMIKMLNIPNFLSSTILKDFTLS